ncbi:MAG: VCBS repeat-containing protein [Candidatus Marinimicrobia bacterium]|nr:VCBS repeat-containing protein [Candidatus Neomarinimicrobiota bacterium]
MILLILKKGGLMRNVTLFTVVTAFLLLTTGLFAINGFDRVAEIPFPEATLNNGGAGNMIAGVDIDEDGLLEIYLVNNNWNDGPTEVIPRIYKLEYDGTNWQTVWSATLDPFYQNTWPCLSLADLDNDGKQELVWGPVNSTSVSANPDRIVVYEHAGGDDFGIDNGDGTYSPNSTWTIVTDDNVNLRPMDWEIADVDNDGVDEIIFADRKGADGGYYFGVCSVDNIPDNADGSETWTLEMSGKDFTLGAGIQNKWDVAVVGNNFYAFCEAEISKLSWDGSAWNYTALSPMAGGSSNQSAIAVDLDEDGTEEILCAVYDWGDDSKKAIMLLQEDGDTLKQTELANISSYWSSGSRGAWGGAVGDIDQDGYLDYVFGSRAGDVNARIFRFAYKGGDITNPDSYELSVIDEDYGSDGIWSIVNIANMDDDPEMEVVYTSSTPMGGLMSSTAPIIVLDYAGAVEFPNLVVAEEVLLNGEIPTNLLFKPGRILDDGTIWFCGMDNSAKETYVFRSVDDGKTFTHNATGLGGRAAQMDAFDQNIAVVATANGKIFRTTDGGVTFTEAYSYNISMLAPGWFDGIRVLNDSVAVAFGDTETPGDMHFVRTTDKGATWTEIEGIDYLGASYGYYTFGNGACNVGESIWCAGLTSAYDSGYVFRSYDAGVTWESFKMDTIVQKYARSIAFMDNDNGMISDRYGAVLKSNDGGETWVKVNNPDTSSSSWVNGVVWIPGTNIIVGLDDIGAYYTTDLGETWTHIEAPTVDMTGDYYLSGVFKSNDFGYIFTDAGKVLRFEGQVVSGIKPSDVKMADRYKLNQNYPNPFNPTTSISFEIPKADHVKLVIYDILGREVISLVDNNLQPGRYAFVWNGKDKNGLNVSTGIYLYQLKADGIVKTRKMTFMK